MDDCLCEATAWTWLDRWSHHRNRVSLARGTSRARRRDRSRVRPPEVDVIVTMGSAVLSSDWSRF